MIKTSNLYYKYRAFNKAFVRQGQHCDVALALPSNQSDIRYVTPWIPLILGAKVLHNMQAYIENSTESMYLHVAAAYLNQTFVVT